MKLLSTTLFILIFQLLGSITFAQQEDFKVPAMTGPVIDQAGLLTRSDRQALSQLLYDFNQRGVAQVQVLIVDTLHGLPIEMASIQITDKYKLGDAKKDNGVLFLIAAKERRLRIEVGQGLEGVIPDAIANRIIQDQVLPLFRATQTSAGIVLGTHQILRLADQEFAESAGLNNVKTRTKETSPLKLIFFILIFLLFPLLNRFGGGGRGGGFHGGGFGGGFGGGGGGWSGGGGGFSGGGASGGW